VLGFLSVSTERLGDTEQTIFKFQSRAGFSECLDLTTDDEDFPQALFQSRAGFSECLDLNITHLRPETNSPVSIPCWVF